MKWRKRKSRFAPLGGVIALLIASSPAIAAVKVTAASWETGFVPFSKSAGIVNSSIVLGPADADSEIEAGEGRVFAKVVVEWGGLGADERSDLAGGVVLADAAHVRHEPVAILYDGVWRPMAFLNKSFRIIRVPENTEMLFSIPRDVKPPLALVLASDRIENVDKQLGVLPSPPKPEAARTMYCIFDGMKLRKSPSPSADSDHGLQAMQEVKKVREYKGMFYVTSANGSGWVHPAALVDSPSVAQRIVSGDPKPISLFVATGFTGEADFQLQIWHGGLQLPNGELNSKPKLNPGNCIVVSQQAGSTYTGPYRPFGHFVADTDVGRLLMLGSDGTLAAVEMADASHLLGPVTIGAVVGILGMSLVLWWRRKRRHVQSS